MPDTGTPVRERLDVPIGLGGFADDVPPRFEPASASVLEAARRHRLLVATAVLVALAAGLALALTRPAVYTATAQLRVGSFDMSVPGAVSGYATASVALATSYGYSVDSPAVVAAVARDLRLPRRRVLDAVSASALPERPVVRVRAEAANEQRAVALANATAAALAHRRIGVVGQRERAQRLRAFQRAAERLAALRAQQRTRQAAYAASGSAAAARALARTEAALAAQQVALDARRDAYVAGEQSLTATPAVELVAPARRAASDARVTLQLYLIIALAAGLSAGLALALLAERRTRYRA